MDGYYELCIRMLLDAIKNIKSDNKFASLELNWVKEGAFVRDICDAMDIEYSRLLLLSESLYKGDIGVTNDTPKTSTKN